MDLASLTKLARRCGKCAAAARVENEKGEVIAEVQQKALSQNCGHKEVAHFVSCTLCTFCLLIVFHFHHIFITFSSLFHRFYCASWQSVCSVEAWGDAGDPRLQNFRLQGGVGGDRCT